MKSSIYGKIKETIIIIMKIIGMILLILITGIFLFILGFLFYLYVYPKPDMDPGGNLEKRGTIYKIEDIPAPNKDIHNIKKLDLSYTQLKDLSVLKDIDFKNITELDLRENKIEDISLFKDIDFKNITEIDLSDNKIEDVSCLEHIHFTNIKQLYFLGNPLNQKSKEILSELREKYPNTKFYYDEK